jgi:tetratricopeptide (TPR) repeat protein
MNVSSMTTEELIDKADRLEEEGAIDEAIECWRAVLKHSSDPMLLCRFGILVMEQGRWVEAEQAFMSAIAKAPNLSIAYESLGLLNLEQNNLEVAQNYFKKSLQIKRSARTLTFLGSAQLRLGLTAAARRSFRKALQVDFNYIEAYFNLALTFRNKQAGKAIAFLQKALELDPEFSPAHRELGWMLRQSGRYLEAESHLRRAIELNPSDGWAYVYLGNLLWAKGELVSAEQALKMGVAIWPDDSLTHWCLASLYEFQGQSHKAERLYERAVQLGKDDPEANLRFGLFLKELGQGKKARFYLEHTLAIDPKNEHARSILSTLRRTETEGH